MPPNPQLDLLEPERIWKETLLLKVKNMIPWQVWENLNRCGEEEVYRTCSDCGDVGRFYYRCSMKFCPLCNWRIARGRSQMLNLWSMQIKQPKHIVLTVRNFDTLTRQKIRSFGKAFAKLRRNKLWRGVKGGCVSWEITNEGRGWHLHAHILADTRWMPGDVLAVTWGQLVGQEYGIVKVKDARGKDYLGEVTKYVVKGSQLVSWHPEEINQFIHAIRGVRMFCAFGTLFHLQRKIKAQLHAMKPPPEPCKCGCSKFVYETETQSILNEVRRQRN